MRVITDEESDIVPGMFGQTLGSDALHALQDACEEGHCCCVNEGRVERRKGLRESSTAEQTEQNRQKQGSRPANGRQRQRPLNTGSKPNLFAPAPEPSQLLLFHSKFDQPCPLNLLPATLP